jgi:hypothetical protein
MNPSAKRPTRSCVLTICGIATVGLLGSCSRETGGNFKKGQRMPARTVEEVLQENADAWMAMPGVAGTAIGMVEGKPCIRIFTTSKPEDVRDKIPAEVEGYPVIIEETGEFRALGQQ